MRVSSALLALSATLVAAVPEMTVKGTSFVNSKTNEKFQIVGMGYQPGGESAFSPGSQDPLSDPDACLRDAALMQILGINAIRVYNVHPNNNHDKCASIFNAAGIYLMIDVNGPNPGQSLTSENPWESYYTSYLNRTFAIVEAFSSYDNTLLFFSANEVVNNVASGEYAPQYIRAVVRDLKSYIKNNIKRQIPVGYSAADVSEILEDNLDYLQCAEDGKDNDISRSDFFALNTYRWCGEDATYDSSGYNELTEDFHNATLPIFLSEYGCIKDPPRVWNETLAIYGKEMTPVFSGATAYQWTQESNGYGIVSVNGSTTYILNQYNMLKEKLGEIDWNSTEAQQPPSAPSPMTCKSSLIMSSKFDSNFTLPATPSGAAELIKNGMKSKPVGKMVDVSSLSVTLDVVDANGNKMSNLAVKQLGDDEFNWQGKSVADTGSTNSSSSGGSGSDHKDGDSAASYMHPMVWAAVVPMLAMLFC